MPTEFRIGLLASTSGPYGRAAGASLCGALLAVEELNRRPQRRVTLVPEIADPAGDLALYRGLADRLLASGIRHVVGCYTSASRKEVIPLFEKRDALLWYPAHYEGFEASSNVVYTAGAPNQHVTPLVGWLLRNRLRRAYCVGSNYVWAWETNRVFREALAVGQGAVIGERYIAVEDCDAGHILADILKARPDFIFCTLIGASAAAFIHQLRAAAERAGLDQPRDLPLLTCNLTEETMHAVPEAARDGHVCSAVYFSSIASERNRRFVAAFGSRFGREPSSDAEAAFNAVQLLTRAREQREDDAIEGMKAAALAIELDAPQGKVRLDPASMHTFLTPRIARSRRDGRFDILEEARAPVRPDPYLLDQAPRLAPLALRLVS